MKILVTGGTGMIGRAFISSFPVDDVSFVVLSRNDPQQVKGFADNVQVVRWDGETPEGWVDHLKNTDVIVNLAGQSIAGGIRWTKGLKKKLVDSRVKAGNALVTALEQTGARPQLFLQASGINYYEYGDEERSEDSPAGISFLSTLSVGWENSSQAVEEMGVRRVVMRIAPVLSRKGGLLKLMKLPYLFFVGGRLGLRGKQWFSWIHIDDLVGFMHQAIENPSWAGTYNLAAPQPVQNKELNRQMGKALRRPWFFHVPRLMLKVFLGEKADLLVGSLKVLPTRLQNEGFDFQFEEISKGLNDVFRKKK